VPNRGDNTIISQPTSGDRGGPGYEKNRMVPYSFQMEGGESSTIIPMETHIHINPLQVNRNTHNHQAQGTIGETQDTWITPQWGRYIVHGTQMSHD
jgi:hypothetical protein